MVKQNMDRQVCVIKAVAYSLATDRQTHVTGTDKSLKIEGPNILSNDIFYFRTVIIGGPIIYHAMCTGLVSTQPL